MKILLLQDIKGLGRKMEIKTVSDGYARNFLIPRKLAMPADRQAVKMKNESETREKNVMSRYRQSAENLSKKSLEFPVKTGDRNEVFGSVNKEQIKKALLDKGLIQNESEIILDKPLKTLGEHFVGVNIGKGIKEEVKIILKPRE